MYLNLVQIAESFGVAEKTVEDWIRTESMPHVADRGRLLFDRAQVTQWSAARGLGSATGFLAPETPAFATGWRLEPLLEAGGIWRGIPASQVTDTFIRVVEGLPGTAPAVRKMLGQRLRAPGGVTLAPVGGGIALPHPSARIALGRDAGVVALILLREPLSMTEPPPDCVPVTRLFFFLAPSPRAHLDLLGRLSRLLSRGPLRDQVTRGAPDGEILDTVAAADAAATGLAPREAGT
jgi:nitrogen PTS system EIIA component